MKFRKNNRIACFQDHGWFTGIPSTIDFVVWKSKIRRNEFELTAPGYGDMSNYGNGAITIFNLTKHMIQKLNSISK